MSISSPLLKMTSVCVLALSASACQPSSPKPSHPDQGDASSKARATTSHETLSLKEPPAPVVIHQDTARATPTAAPPTLALSILEREKAHPGDSPHKDWVAVGREHLQTSRFDEAVIAFRKALFSAPADGKTWFLLGKAYLQSDDPERGLECFTEALQQNPTSEALHVALVRGYLKAGESDQALTHAVNLARLAPQTFQSSYLLGRAYSSNAMWKESMQSFKQALTHKPNHVYANNNLGFVALQVGDLDTAVPALKQATLSPNALHYMFNNLGIAYERNKEPLKSLAAFQQALELSPQYVKAVVNRDRVFASLTEAQHTELADLEAGVTATTPEVQNINTNATLAVAIPKDSPGESEGATPEAQPETAP